jgi:hypothetical protein
MRQVFYQPARTLDILRRCKTEAAWTVQNRKTG